MPSLFPGAPPAPTAAIPHVLCVQCVDAMSARMAVSHTNAAALTRPPVLCRVHRLLPRVPRAPPQKGNSSRVLLNSAVTTVRGDRSELYVIVVSHLQSTYLMV
jgi:hypothetical protein